MYRGLYVPEHRWRWARLTEGRSFWALHTHPQFSARMSNVSFKFPSPTPPPPGKIVFSLCSVNQFGIAPLRSRITSQNLLSIIPSTTQICVIQPRWVGSASGRGAIQSFIMTWTNEGRLLGGSYTLAGISLKLPGDLNHKSKPLFSYTEHLCEDMNIFFTSSQAKCSIYPCTKCGQWK